MQQGPPAQSEGAAQGSWFPETEAEKKAIQEQLERILYSPLFKNSKRYPSLLRYVVERALEGHREHLKERTLGIEVFGREPDYDTNLDPVVRTTAVEIRKRIAQYYHELGHESEIRIDFPPGNYLPEFRLPQKLNIEPPQPALKPEAESKLYAGKAVLLGAVCLAALILAAAFWKASAPTALDLFWAPVFQSPEAVLVGIGGYPTEGPNPVVSLMDLQRSERVAFADSTALAHVVALLRNQNKAYHIRFQASGKVDEMKDGPSVLIGAFNNSWALRLTDQLRFGFVRDSATHISRILDRQNPQNDKYSHLMTAPYGSVQEDYAIISRVWDPTTGKVVVTASGLAKFGTAAAGEFLTNNQYLEEVVRKLPAGWEKKNLQILIATPVIGHSAGPPRVLETQIW
jgi:hypothetical protein